MTWLYLVGALILAILQADRYARMDIDPDWAMFNLQGQTGSRYGRDFVDCKTPMIHWWFALLAWIVGKSVYRVRLAHHGLISLAAIGLGVTHNDIGGGLILLVLVQAGALLAFHGNVGQIPALGVYAALVGEPWLAAVGMALACAFEPKLAPAALVWMVISGRWELAITGILTLGLMVLPALWEKRWLGWLIEANLTIPARMQRLRNYPWMPWYSREGLVYILPVLAFAIWQRPEWRFWIAAAVFMAVQGMGKVIRQNHLIPLAGWIAAAGWPAPLALAWLAIDWTGAGFYMGDIWGRFYRGLCELNAEARVMGQRVKDWPGKLWVNALSSAAVHVWAAKPVPYGLNEQAEIRDVATERRAAWKMAWPEDPPEIVVQGPLGGVTFQPIGYRREIVAGSMTAWRRS